MRQCAPAVYLDFWTSAYQAIDDQAASVPMELAAPAARSFKPSAAVPPKKFARAVDLAALRSS
jgi:hypothetical protein